MSRSAPPRMHHYAMAHGETVLQLRGTGPWRLVYLNEADDRSAILTPTLRTRI